MIKVKDINGNEVNFEAAWELLPYEFREHVINVALECTDNPTEQELFEQAADLMLGEKRERFAPYFGLPW